MSELLANGKVTLMCGDSREQILSIPDNSIDSVVTDPPYALVSIGKRFGKEGSTPAKFGTDGAYSRASKGFMNCSWDTGETAFDPDFWVQILRVLKPGGYLAAFSGTRTYHRMACAIEDAGFDVRDQLSWIFGSGFPKSHNVSKSIDLHLFRLWLDADPARRAKYDAEIDKAKSADKKKLIDDKWKAIGGFLRGVTGTKTMPDIRGQKTVNSAFDVDRGSMEYDYTEAATDEAREWEGFGTALKPAHEPVCLARKQLIGTVAENVLAHGTGGLNIDGCRVDAEARIQPSSGAYDGLGDTSGFSIRARPQRDETLGRWPANILLDGSAEVSDTFPSDEFGVSVSRYFYSAKADGDDRLGSKHPTIKPVNLMQHLVALLTRKGGTCLDPFAGTGTTGEAAFREGCHAVLIEREPEYQNDIRRRMSLVLGGLDERKRESIKASGKTADAGPLFALMGGK